MFINTHTHSQIYDANIEVVNVGLAEGEKPMYYSYGLHPWHLHEQELSLQLLTLQNKAREPHCLAIGECGLDRLSKASMELQEQAFFEQVKLANEIGKPLIIHCVKAFNELLNILNEAENSVPVIIHGFNNNENIARVLSDAGCFFSFGKALLGYESNAAKTLKSTGRRKFFLETDDSDISIKYIYRKAADLLGVSEEILQHQIQSNFENVFCLKV